MDFSSPKAKCSVCKKKISIIEMITSKCKCDEYFCKNHKYPDTKSSSMGHICNYDYYKEHTHNLMKQCILVVADKVDKI